MCRSLSPHQPVIVSSHTVRLFLHRNVIFTLLCLATISGCGARPTLTTTSQMNTEQKFWVRVLLLDNAGSCSLKINRPFTVSDPQTNTELAHFKRLKKAVNVTISNGQITIADRTFEASRITISPEKPYIFNLNGSDYRGKLSLITNSARNSFSAINFVPLEPYLAGVIGAEMPDYWEPAALRAQAIAARTYCLYIKKHFGLTRSWDVSKTTANQVYLGVKAESSQVWNAVNGTAGQILVCSREPYSEEIFPAYYSSACGGHTENSQNVFGDSFEPLCGVPCPYCIDIARPDNFFWPMVQFDKIYVTQKLLQKYPKLEQLGEIKNIEPSKQSSYERFSRLTMLRLTGSAGADSIRAEDFRLTIDPTGQRIKSMVCSVVGTGDKWAFLCGRGYGHGVGMCQCGAQGMARQGSSTEEILIYYYPGSKLAKVY